MSSQLLQFAVSLAAISVLVLIAYALGLGRGARIANAEQARALADNAVCGFTPTEIALDRSGRAALLADQAGRLMLLRRHGAQFAARLLDARASVQRDGDLLTIATGEANFAPASIALDHAVAAAWEQRVAALED